MHATSYDLQMPPVHRGSIRKNKMTQEVLMERTAATTTATAAAGAVYFGLTANELAAWVGVGIAALSAVTQAAISFYFKLQELRLKKQEQKQLPECSECPHKEK